MSVKTLEKLLLDLNPESPGQSEFYRLRSPKPPWGDYGSTLITGEVYKKNGQPFIERTGPFVPPIALGYSVTAVTEETKNRIEGSGLTGFEFTEATIIKAVALDWLNEWDVTSSEPYFYPSNGSPLNFLKFDEFDDPLSHDQSLAESMSPLWSLIASQGIQRERKEQDGKTISYLLKETWNGKDFVLDSEDRLVVSHNARQWLETHFRPWIRFESLEWK